FLQSLGDARLSWNADFLEQLLTYDWPLNIRELRTVAQRLTIDAEDGVTLGGGALEKTLGHKSWQTHRQEVPEPPEPSKEELLSALWQHEGNIQELAKHYQKH